MALGKGGGRCVYSIVMKVEEELNVFGVLVSSISGREGGAIQKS